jgi:hypothetical protein
VEPAEWAASVELAGPAVLVEWVALAELEERAEPDGRVVSAVPGVVS